MTKPRRRRVFLGSLMDWLDPKVPIEWLAEVLDIVRRCPGLDFLMLTKRPELWDERLGIAKGIRPTNGWAEAWHAGVEIPRNIWIGVSVEDRLRKPRLEDLNRIPASVKFASFEPMLEDLRLSSDDVRMLNWAIVGGESGPNRRDCGVDAIVNVYDQCRAAKVPCFVKQDCAAKPGQQGRIPDHAWNCKEFPR